VLLGHVGLLRRVAPAAGATAATRHFSASAGATVSVKLALAFTGLASAAPSALASTTSSLTSVVTVKVSLGLPFGLIRALGKILVDLHRWFFLLRNLFGFES
jgi:hypothetical protein